MASALPRRVAPGTLVVLVGPPAAGKSTTVTNWRDRGLRADQVVSRDEIRRTLTGDMENHDAEPQVTAIMDTVIETRLARRLTTVVDATNLEPVHRAGFVVSAARFGRPLVAVRFGTSPQDCLAWNRTRNRVVPEHRMVEMVAAFENRATVGLLRQEGFEVIDLRRVAPQRVEFLPDAGHGTEMDARHLTGPFDVIGDVHGCFHTLVELRRTLGYDADWSHPEGRFPVFVGDPNDKGPHSLLVLRDQLAALRSGQALAVASNHCNKLVRYLRAGRDGGSFGLAETLAQIRSAPDADELTAMIVDVYGSLPGHLLLDGGDLCVAHAGLLERHQGRWEPKRSKDSAFQFALYGATTGQTEPGTGLPERADWAAEYSGPRAVVHGHVIVDDPVWRNGVIDIDTGCYQGGGLSALRWPERNVVRVPTDQRDLR